VMGAGLVLCAGAAGLRGRKPSGRALATVAALLGMALGGLLFLAQVVNDEPDRLLIVWAAIILVSAWTVRESRAVTPAEERAKGVWSQLPILKSAVSLGLLFSLAQFWYTSIYVPTTAPASLSLDTKIEAAKARGNQLAVKGTVTVHNTSNTRVNVLASSLDLRADGLQPERYGRRQLSRQIQDVDELRYETAERFASRTKSIAVAHARVVDEGTYFDPGESITTPIFTWLPRKRFDALYLYAVLSVARGRVLNVESGPQPKVTRGRQQVVILTEVPEGGWLRRLTRGPRYLRVEYPSHADTTDVPTVSFSPNQRPNPPDDFNQRLRRFYGVAETSGTAIMPLPAK